MRSAPDAIVLCGGGGTRLRSVTDGPKAMVSVGGPSIFGPKWLAEGKQIRAILDPAVCYDIGTPERYQRAAAAKKNGTWQYKGGVE